MLLLFVFTSSFETVVNEALIDTRDCFGEAIDHIESFEGTIMAQDQVFITEELNWAFAICYCSDSFENGTMSPGGTLQDACVGY